MLDRIFLDNQLLSSYNLNSITSAKDGLPQVYVAQVDSHEECEIQHVDTDATLGVIMYGFGQYRSHGHPGGLNLAPGVLHLHEFVFFY